MNSNKNFMNSNKNFMNSNKNFMNSNNLDFIQVNFYFGIFV